MTIRRILLLLSLCLLAFTARGATVQVGIPAVEDTTHEFDLGVQISEVLDYYLHVEGEAVDHYYECQNLYPGGEVDYEHWESTHVWFQISSNGVTGDGDWYTPNGFFAENLDLWLPSNPAFLSDGRGTLYFDTWVELFPPESEDCGLSAAGSLDFTGPLTLVVEYTPAVSNERSTWSSVKALFD